MLYPSLIDYTVSNERVSMMNKSSATAEDGRPYESS